LNKNYINHRRDNNQLQTDRKAIRGFPVGWEIPK
jgi:hypothetical protein